MSSSRMREFWDDRAREDPFYFVDNGQVYRWRNPESFWRRGARELDRLLAAVGAQISPSDDVVEIGCGVGRMTRLLGERARSVTALDVSPRMLELAAEHCRSLGNVELRLGDGQTLAGVADGSADVCISHVVFQHIPDPKVTLGYIREMGRVLRPGGWAAFQVSNDPVIHRRRTGLEGIAIAVRAALRRGPRGQADPCWLGSAVDLGDVRQAAADGSMDVERIAGEGTQMCFVLTRRRSG